MKKLSKLFIGAMIALLLCGQTFAQNSKASQALSIVEALQTTFQSVSDTLLPSVVEVDITKTKTYSNP